MEKGKKIWRELACLQNLVCLYLSGSRAVCAVDYKASLERIVLKTLVFAWKVWAALFEKIIIIYLYILF
jgi:hypothetical protein